MDETPMDSTEIAPAPGGEGQDFAPGEAPGEATGAGDEDRAGDIVAAVRDENAALLARLRTELIASEPAVDAAMVAGMTLAELEASFAAARESVRRVREALRREEAATIPAGAPGRLSQPPSSPLEKIRAGIAGLQVSRG